MELRSKVVAVVVGKNMKESCLDNVVVVAGSDDCVHQWQAGPK